MAKNFDEWIDSNTLKAQEIIDNRIFNEEDKLELESTMMWYKSQLLQVHDAFGLLLNSISENCSEEQFEDIFDLFMTFLHNNFVVNTSLGQKLYEEGKIETFGSTYLYMPQGDE